MQTFFYNLAGGINQSATKIELGLNTKKLYWTDSKNVEIFQDNGIIRQKGNILLAALEQEEKIIAVHQMKEGNVYKLLIATSEGNIFVYTVNNQTLIKLDYHIDGSGSVNFTDFLDGVVLSGTKNKLLYINNDDDYLIEDCNLIDVNGDYIKAEAVCVYAGRLWVGYGATLYYSALGTYNDFSTEGDAGYINNFYTDTDDIIALKTYKDYLAIYKENSVYLLSGSSSEDFKISPFADKGTTSSNGVVNVNNKQYFIGQGVFSLEQAGLLSQIQLGEEITLKIKAEFDNFDKTRFNEIIVLHYEAKNQVWYFIPYKNNPYFHTIWIYSYIQQAWFKRVLIQDITCACIFDGYIVSADAYGKVYREDFGNTFAGSPIEFMWKSPFLSAGNSNVRKNIEEFYFILDENYDNNFNFSVYKNYDSSYKDDTDLIYSTNSENLIWYGENLLLNLNFNWHDDSTSTPTFWAKGADSFYKAEISESNYSVQLCVEGNKIEQNAAIIGLEFKEIYLDE